MSISRNKLYTLLFIACTAGYIWLYFVFTQNNMQISNQSVCIFKHVTGIACPSCGSTRSIISLLKGDFKIALLINPLGIVIALIMLFTPLWILLDLSTKKNTLYHFYYKIEDLIKKRKYAIPLVLLILINWIWNISKGL